MKFNKLILILVFLVLFCNFVYASLVFDEVICAKDGSLELSVYSKDSKILVDDVKVIAGYKDPFFDFTLSEFKVNGTWDKDYISDKKTIFRSDGAQIRDAGNYDIILEYNEEGVNKNLVYGIDCVGLIFSCELVNVEIKNCTSVDNKYFNLLVELGGMNQSVSRKIDIFEDISYGVVAGNDYKDIKGLFSDRGNLPENIKINKIGDNLYLFSKEFINNSILSINIYLKSLQAECKNSKLYDYMECVRISTNEIEKEEISKEIKQEEILEITGDVIIAQKSSSFNKNYLIYIIIIGIVILLIIIGIIKKQKVNKWV